MKSTKGFTLTLDLLSVPGIKTFLGLPNFTRVVIMYTVREVF